MNNFNNKDAQEYLYKSYTSVDGLWFMKVEELLSFEKALQLDIKVWEIVPKIQSRFIKSRLISSNKNFSNQNSLEQLFVCFKIKLKYDGFKFKALKSKNKKKIEFIISKCPWHELLINSKRENIAEKIGSNICKTEYKIWAKEFGDNIKFELTEQLCNGCCNCRISYNIL
ncbi:MAG: L-2-amino-thiazoline-4-carboxylic acid hydrolase [Actinobacteria bacterium]|nr:L-2-amino-thiazoline-4-carboxylic acid hydrolase [Cyanobacteriota bacterium]MCL5770945.1 L-2-amino-thiazoline-4-carboxylic acid hydrolase [Actinomycetota bacterium]